MSKIAALVKEIGVIPGARVFVAPRKTKDVVTVEGSVMGGLSHVGNRMVPDFAAELLDAGTSLKSKEQIREALAARGISLTFSALADRLYFSGSCLPEDLSFLLSTIAECLSDASFPKREVEVARTRLLGELEEEKTDTKTQASITLLRALYEVGHPNYSDTTLEKEASLKAATRADLLSFRKKLGREGMVLAVVGDVSSELVVRACTPLKKLPEGSAKEVSYAPNKKLAPATRKLVSIKDKANIDTFFGVSVPYTYNDPRFEAFGFFCDMLGGKGLFTGHLMRAVREREGLTYGIYALPGGFEHARDGIFRIWATFSPATFRKAVDITQKEIEVFLKTGLTKNAIEERKQKLLGSFVVGLSTTRGLAAALHKVGREGKPLSYLDEYQKMIEAMTLEDVESVAKEIDFKRLVVAAAGTFST